MNQLLRAIDRRLAPLRGSAILALSLVGVVVVGVVDYLAGYEVAFSLFYLGPVATAAWYGGRQQGVAVALASCLGWYIADVAAGHAYSHPAIPVWNALVRFGFFLITGLLLAALRQALAAQQRLARIDDLTGLYTRRAFEERLQHDIALARRRLTPLSLAIVDLDDFKSVNDNRGHAEGDRVLRIVGQALSLALREVDAAARIGGDEFALVLPDTDSSGARRAVEKADAEIRQALAAAGAAASCSIGVVTFQSAPSSIAGAVDAADQLMYEVKRRGKGAMAFSVSGQVAEPHGAADDSI